MKELTNYLFELGTLKLIKRSGWWLINIKDPESVAEHCFRAGTIGFVLAHLESADVNKVTKMSLFNDLHETRINDLHKVGQRYIDFKIAETAVQREQTSTLGKIGEEIFSLHEEFQQQKTKESHVARDADLLENAFQAKEYLEVGYKDAQNWLDNIRKVIRTASAKQMLNEIEQTSSNDWWRNLKKIER